MLKIVSRHTVRIFKCNVIGTSQRLQPIFKVSRNFTTKSSTPASGHLPPPKSYTFQQNQNKESGKITSYGPIQEDIFELELMEEIKTGPLAHLFGKGMNTKETKELMLQAINPLFESGNKKSDSPVATSRASLGLTDPYRVEIITCHRTELKSQRSEKRTYQKGEGNLLPRPVVDLFTLKQIHFADMDPKKDHVYEGFAIKLTFIEDAITGKPSINQIAEDEHGDAQRIFIYNFPQNADNQNKIGFGCKVTVVNPYFRLAKDGRPMIRVDDISLMFLHSTTTNKKRCRYCGNECESTVPCRHCKRSFYCSKVCLKNDSMELNHRDVCLMRL